MTDRILWDMGASPQLPVKFIFKFVGGIDNNFKARNH